MITSEININQVLIVLSRAVPIYMNLNKVPNRRVQVKVEFLIDLQHLLLRFNLLKGRWEHSIQALNTLVNLLKHHLSKHKLRAQKLLFSRSLPSEGQVNICPPSLNRAAVHEISLMSKELHFSDREVGLTIHSSKLLLHIRTSHTCANEIIIKFIIL